MILDDGLEYGILYNIVPSQKCFFITIPLIKKKKIIARPWRCTQNHFYRFKIDIVENNLIQGLLFTSNFGVISCPSYTIMFSYCQYQIIIRHENQEV